MITRAASCSCGQLRLECQGEPTRISICHCLECQKRTGGIFGAQACFPRAFVSIEGLRAQWSRAGESGQKATFSFCPRCASTVFWEPDGAPQIIYVAVGAFADPTFPPPRYSVYEERRHAWAFSAAQLPLEHTF
jgi:hypothetical protein